MPSDELAELAFWTIMIICALGLFFVHFAG